MTDGEVRRDMLAVGAVQALLLAPSIVISVVGLATLSVAEYAAWALLFALGSAAIVIDFGSFQLAQILRAEGTMRRGELLQLFARASIAPVLLAVATSLLWNGFLDTFVGGASVASPTLPAVLGAATLARAWQNVANGLALGAGDERTRRRAALGATLVQLALLPLVAVFSPVYLLSAVYGLGAITGLCLLAPVLRSSIGAPSARKPNQVGTRAVIGGLNVLLTQLDRLVVGALVPAAGLVAYDFAARLVATAKIGCVLVATGATAKSAALVESGSDPHKYLRPAQAFLDRLCLLAFALTPLSVWVLTSIVKPEIASEAAAIAVVLSVGHGVHATTATITGFLSGLRRPRAELTYLAISAVLLAVMAWPLGTLAGAVGVATSVALALVVGSLWLRLRGLSSSLGERSLAESS